MIQGVGAGVDCEWGNLNCLTTLGGSGGGGRFYYHSGENGTMNLNWSGTVERGKRPGS